MIPSISPEEADLLDKYYTKVEVARRCYLLMKQYVGEDSVFIEPSAGAGAFLRAVDDPILGFDIAPESPEIVSMDFLSDDPRRMLPPEYQTRPLAGIGNPPFGRRASIAIPFLNRSLDMFGIVGFIVPVQFRKWSVQSKINTNARLIMDERLEDESFEHLGKPYRLRCSFQIWSLHHSNLPDHRIPSKPKTSHPDFDMWQFNRTDEAAKYFDYEWDFAVPRQGFQDYTFKALRKEDCDRKKQWIFFKAHSEQALKNLLMLDFTALSEKNTGTPGFGKADVVEAYEEYCSGK